ncbi:PREDICTED: uncharacterized protein LOC107351061 [Acropora digitifera]|uniref:uncharacterized protein LOC107351061 n=1 Tax=Acropora digitifera TaxID=70779 RepID=UPI00077A38DC|nr:PREDICTED: uncharacterized protein LOC107351061 [Acropora digitifera]
MADQDNFDASALLRNNSRGWRLGRTFLVSALKMYLQVTGLWYPKAAVEEEATWKEVVKTIAQLTILGGLLLNYCYELGVFGSHTLVDIEYKETVTTIMNVIWFARMPLMYMLGICYFRKRHFDNLLQMVNLPARCWRKAKKAIYASFFAVIAFAFVLPLSSSAVQMKLNGQLEKNQTFKPKQMSMNLGFSAVARFFSLPMVFVCIFAICIISSDICQFKRAIQQWSANEEAARGRFINIKRVIEHAEKAFQPFLVTQLVFLCVLLLPSIFSVVERFQDEATYKMTLIGPSNIKKASRNDVNTGNAIFVNSTASSLRLDEGEGLHSIRSPQLFTVMESRKQAWRRELTEQTKIETSWQGIIIVFCGGLSDFLEMFIVYSLPLILLTRLHNLMTSLSDVVQNLEFAEQRKNGFLFQERRVTLPFLEKGQTAVNFA